VSFDRSELESLLFDWDADSLDDVGVARVREILRNSQEARGFYVRHQLLSVALHQEADAMIEPGNALPEPSGTAVPASQPKRKRGFRYGAWIIAAAALLFCGLAGRLAYLETTNNETAKAEATSAGVALVTRLVGVEFESENDAFVTGKELLPGRIAFESGLAQIEFFCGATLIVEGPAELYLKSSSLARISEGRIRAQVPPAARGFSIEVDDMKVIDLGTEFGLSVSDGDADIQVFDGEVELRSPAKSKQLLTAGQAIKRNRDGVFESAAATPNEFVDIASMKTRADGQRVARFESWKQHSDEIRNDPRLIAYYAFDDQGLWGRKLQSSIAPENRELDGAIVGARRVEGRWPSKSGLEFKRPCDRVRVQIPGEFGSLTFACWVRIDSLDRWYNSLFLTDNYNQGEPHWQILDTGQLFFSVRHKPDDVSGTRAKAPTHHTVLSPEFWKPSMSGRWLHLATTYDAEAGKTTHYLNGELLHEETIAEELKVTTTRIGAASIGNWSIPIKPDAEYAVRNLNGSMDEFMIFSSALGEDEIQEIYVNGKP
jgi:hypothetical protein